MRIASPGCPSGLSVRADAALAEGGAEATGAWLPPVAVGFDGSRCGRAANRANAVLQKTHIGFTWSPISTLERLEVAQRGDHVLAEQPQRVHQVRLGHRAEIELAEKRIERSFTRPPLELAGDRVGRTQQNQVVFQQVVRIEHVE